jgi:glycosyltransferase involved in cell wall biosynthesis
MKVLHIIPTYYPAYVRGGPIWSVHNLNRWLIKKGIDVTVYTTDIDVPENTSKNQEVDVDGVKVYYFKKSLSGIWAYSYSLHKTLKKTASDFDLVHITSTFLSASALGSYYARKNNIPYIISPRGNLMKEPVEKKSFLKKIFYIGLIEERNLQNASAIHFTVPQEREEYKGLGFGCQKEITIPNGIDSDSFEKAEAGQFRKKFNISEDKKIILFLSRISWKKGLDTLIPAFAEVSKKRPEVVLVIAGGDSEGYKQKVEGWIKENSIEDKVIFTGMITGADKTAALQDSDIFVLPSYSENFGMAVAEAMYFSLPVVISNKIGIASEVKKANAGIVTLKEKLLIANEIIRLLESPELAKNLGEKGKKLVEEKYLMPAIADRWIEEYNKLVRSE